MTTSPNTSVHDSYDVAIIGGGAAGLAAAVALARSLRRVVVIDAGSPRNAPAHAAHNLLGREGISPTELLETGRAEARGYGAEIRSGQVTTLTRHRADSPGVDSFRADSFCVETDDGGRIDARRIILATGLVDELPNIPGVARFWGSQVLHCPYCHGYEVRGERIAVVATSPMSIHQALLFSQLSSQVTVVAHDISVTEDERAQLSARGIRIIEQQVLELVGDDDTLTGLRLADGSSIDVDAVVVAPIFRARTDLYIGLGGVPNDTPMGPVIGADMMGRTDIEGVWTAGNVTNLAAMVTVAAGSGLMAGAAVNADLVEDDTQAALARGVVATT